MASELIKSIDVFKGFTADMTEGGVGGTVSIQTRRPLELKKTLFSASAAGQYLDLMDKVTPRGNLTYGDKFMDDRLGILLNATYDHVKTRGDFLRNTEWVALADFDKQQISGGMTKLVVDCLETIQIQVQGADSLVGGGIL